MLPNFKLLKFAYAKLQISTQPYYKAIIKLTKPIKENVRKNQQLVPLFSMLPFTVVRTEYSRSNYCYV